MAVSSEVFPLGFSTEFASFYTLEIIIQHHSRIWGYKLIVRFTDNIVTYTTKEWINKYTANIYRVYTCLYDSTCIIIRKLDTLQFLSLHRVFWYLHSSFTNKCTFIKTLITIYIKVRWLLHVSVYDHHQGACNWAWLKSYWY